MGGPNEDHISAAITVHVHGAEGSPEVGANLKETQPGLHTSFHLKQGMCGGLLSVKKNHACWEKSFGEIDS
jgi:hypothetical protein